MSQHTPTPWFASKGVVYEQATGSPLGNDCDYATDVANAERIVACVNACEGVPTEVLEAYTVLEKLREKDAQRDELLAALEIVTKELDDTAWSSYVQPMLDQANAAIARAKGGAA